MSAPDPSPGPAAPDYEVGKRRRFQPLLVVLAMLFLLEAWLWRHMGPVVRAVAELIPFARLKAAVARWAENLPPYAALLLFLCPLLLLEPVEGLAVWAYAHQQWVLGSLCLLAVKLFGVGIMAFLFQVCERQLLRIGWFARLAGLFFTVKAWADAEIAPLKARVRAFAARIGAVVRDFWPEGTLGWRIAALRRRIFARRGGIRRADERPGRR